MTSPVKLWRRQKYIPELLNREGEVITWTVVHTPPLGFKQTAPYPAGLIKLRNGQKLSGQIVDISPEKIRAGLKVKTVLRKIKTTGKEDIIPYGIKFKPINNLKS